MIQDREHSREKCIPRINAYWRRMGVAVEARMTAKGEITSRLTDGLPRVKLPQHEIVSAYKRTGLFKEKAA